jgi:hypothetical protein
VHNRAEYAANFRAIGENGIYLKFERTAGRIDFRYGLSATQVFRSRAAFAILRLVKGAATNSGKEAFTMMEESPVPRCVRLPTRLAVAPSQLGALAFA